MQTNNIQPDHKNRKKKRIGRGGKKGTYSGKGMKGQKSRAGRKMEPSIRGIIKRYPKLRGYKNNRIKNDVACINLSYFDRFDNGEKITPETLIKLRIIRKIKGRMPIIKILGNGELKKKLVFEGFAFSKKAQEKINELDK